MILHEHPLRQAVLAEIHARPFALVEDGTRIVHFAFTTRPAGEPDPEREGAPPLPQAEGPRQDPWQELHDWCRREGVPLPPPGTKHFATMHKGAALSWEQHTEFVTLTLRISQPGAPFGPRAPVLDLIQTSPPCTGPLLVAVDMHVLASPQDQGAERLFDEASTLASEVHKGAALVMTDLKMDEEGFVRWLIINRSFTPQRCGALAQRLLEIETYRNFAMLGLAEAQRVAPSLRDIETTLVNIGRKMTLTEGLEANHSMLDKLTALAAQLEMDAVHSAYRFGASRAYHEIILQRLKIIEEVGVSEGSTIAAFLNRRFAPAMRTCETTAGRQADLSRKLTRATNLLRTRVDVELERQNRDLLSAMNERTRLQLRLQQTVEGLSVAAISYYVVGLFGYVAKALKDTGTLSADPAVLGGLFVPVAILGVWLAVRRIRRSHADHTI